MRLPGTEKGSASINCGNWAEIRGREMGTIS